MFLRNLFTMSKKYSIHLVTTVRDATNVWQIYEKSTNQTIFQSHDKQRIESLKFKLENGSGFNGYTPHFFTQNYPLCNLE